MRRLRLALTILSLACCLLLLIAWPVSHRLPIEFESSVTIGGSQPLVECSRGSLVFRSQPYRLAPVPTMASYRSADFSLADEYGGNAWIGFGLAVTVFGHVVWCPLWFPILLSAIPPALWLRGRWKQAGTGFPVETTS